MAEAALPVPVIGNTKVSAAQSATILAEADLQALRKSVDLLESVSLAARLTNVLGKQIELASAVIPKPARQIVARATESALKTALHAAIASIGTKPGPSRKNLHKAMAAASGAAGGAFGLPALAAELPVSTTIMLRAIADIARAEGENLSDPATVLACLEVFALGGRNAEDDYMEGSYFAVRAALSQAVVEAAKYVAHSTAINESAPVVVRFISQIAARFGLVVSQKVAAQAMPVIGAVGGAAVNVAFMDHFQGLAHGHFTVRRLERLYGAEPVQAEYQRLRMAAAKA